MTRKDQVALGICVEPRSLDVTTLEVAPPALPQTEDSLRLREERLRLAQQAARVGTFEWNLQTGMNAWTAELEALYGLGCGDFGKTQHSWEELVHPEDRAAARQAVQHALDSGEAVEAEWRVIWPDGSLHWLMGRFRMFRDSAGQPQRLLGVNLDITERKRSEQQLRELHADLERALRERTLQLVLANRELEAFSYSVAHDLRAPLRGMHGFSKILLDEYGATLNQDARDCLRRIQGNAVVMGELIDGLLALARVTRGALAPVAVELSGLARAAAAALAAQDPERAVQVVIRDGLYGRIDRALGRMLFDNLLGNAWKFTRQAASARVEVGCLEQQGELVYFVRDNGVGFNMEYANKLFVPFQRLHAPKEFPGTGVGLAACYRIVSRHGGCMWGEGKEGEGAAFFFTLPRSPAGAEQSVEEPPA